MFLGSSVIKKAYLGDIEIKKVYLGINEMYSSGEEPSVLYTNRITNNSNFINTTGWTFTFANGMVSNSNMLVTGTGVGKAGTAKQSGFTAYATGKVIYVRLKYELGASANSVDMQLAATGMTTKQVVLRNTPEGLIEYIDSALVTVNTGGSGNLDLTIRHNYTDAASANGKVLIIKEVMAIDVTADGLTSYTQAQLDALPFKA